MCGASARVYIGSHAREIFIVQEILGLNFELPSDIRFLLLDIRFLNVFAVSVESAGCIACFLQSSIAP